jgi:hypothetical protein
MVIVHFILRFLSRHQQVLCICHDNIVSTVRYNMSVPDTYVDGCTCWVVDWLVFAHEEGGDVGCESANDLVLAIDVSPCPVVGQQCLFTLAYSIPSVWILGRLCATWLWLSAIRCWLSASWKAAMVEHEFDLRGKFQFLDQNRLSTRPINDQSS